MAARADAKVIRLRGKALPSLGKEVVLVRVGSAKRPTRSANRSDEAAVLVRKLGRALSKLGISKEHVPGKVFAYSACPEDMTKIVREAADGTRTVGRVVGCKFRAE